MPQDLIHARRLLDILEDQKLRIPLQMYEEFTQLVELASRAVSTDYEEREEALSELESFLL